MSNPVDGETNVGRTTPISLTFSEPVNPSTVTNDTIGLFLDDGTELGKSLSISADNTVVTLTLTLPASRTLLVAATSDVTDFSGNPLVDYASRFSTANDFDVGRPSIVTSRPGTARRASLRTPASCSTQTRRSIRPPCSRGSSCPRTAC